MGRTCGEPNEIKKNTHPKNITALFREQVRRLATYSGGSGGSAPRHPQPAYTILTENTAGPHEQRGRTDSVA